MRRHFNEITQGGTLVQELTPVYLEKGVYVMDYYLEPARGKDVASIVSQDKEKPADARVASTLAAAPFPRPPQA